MLLPGITLLQHHATHSNRHSQIKRKLKRTVIVMNNLLAEAASQEAVGGELDDAHPIGLLLLARFPVVDAEVRLLRLQVSDCEGFDSPTGWPSCCCDCNYHR